MRRRTRPAALLATLFASFLLCCGAQGPLAPRGSGTTGAAPATEGGGDEMAAQPNQLDPNAPSANANAPADSAVPTSPSAPATVRNEPGLDLVFPNHKTFSLRGQPLGVPLPVVDAPAAATDTFSYYGGKLYAASGCLGRQNAGGGYLMLRACEDANLYIWSQYSGSAFAAANGNNASDVLGLVPCPTGRAECARTVVANDGGAIEYNVRLMHAASTDGSGPAPVMVHLAASPNECLTDSGQSAPTVATCDANNAGQRWLIYSFEASAGDRMPMSGLGHCLGATSEQPSQPRLTACNSSKRGGPAWSFERRGHFHTASTSGTPRRLYLDYDAKTRALSFRSGSAPPEAVWGFGPYPLQLQTQGQAP